MNQRTINIFYALGAIFLFVDLYLSFVAADYWQIYKDLIFLAIIVYMIFVYPKRKVYLIGDLYFFLLFYFVAYGIKSYMESDLYGIILAVLYTIGFIVYKVYRKKHKYSFYLKK